MEERVPMRIKIRWQHGQWWAYFNGYPKSWFSAVVLDDMCNAIRKMWPAGSTAEADYEDFPLTH